MNSASDLVQALTAATTDVDPAESGHVQDCHDRVKLTFFFDGTGNNRDADNADQKWSNVARLFDAARRDPANGIYAVYVSGIGTKLNREEPWWRLDKYARDSGVGAGTGWGAGARLVSGDIGMNDRLKRALEVAVGKAGNELKVIYNQNQEKGFSELSKALGSHRLIKSIEVSFFGFSRGAALARAFVNRLLKQCKADGGRLTYQGLPITFRFLGIFETVASMGRPAKNDFQQVDLRLPRELQRCVHYVAAHEVRYSFPVDLIRQEGEYPSGWKEVVFPGVHSDVGGGYTPTAQARSNSLGRVPLCGMFREATLGGVRLWDWNKVSKDVALKPKFVVSETTRKLYDAYMASSDAQSGTVEQRIQAHMRKYFAYRHAVTTAAVPSPDEINYERQVQAHSEKIGELGAQVDAISSKRVRNRTEQTRLRALSEQLRAEKAKLKDLQAGKQQVGEGEASIAAEAAALREKQRNGEPLVLSKIDAKGVRAFTTHAESWMVDAYYGPTPNADVIEFFDTLVHDSKAGFLGGMEPWSYFRKRGVWESAQIAD